MKKLLSGIVLAGALLSSTAAHAVLTITQTLTFTPQLFGTGNNTQTQTFNQFDTMGGRFVLQSVDVSWISAFNTNITATSGSGNTRTLQTTASFTSALTTTGNLFGFTNTVSGTSGNYTLAGQDSTATFPVSGSASNTFTATNLTPYFGTGTVAVTNTLSNIQGTITRLSIPGNGNGNQTLTGGTSLGSFQIIYTYIDLIPEPQTWAMLIAGFGMVGAAMRRNRRLQAA